MTNARALAELLALHSSASLAWQAGQEAANFLHTRRPDHLAVESKSSLTDAVTEMDRRAESIISEFVLSARPFDAILGEEGGQRSGSSGVRWIVDPLDGTVNYLYRLPNWAVSIAVEVAGEVEVGVVIAPALREAYVAIRGQGAWVVSGNTAARIRCSDEGELGTSLIATGFSYDALKRQNQARLAQHLIGSIRDLRRLGAASMDLCWTAAGRLEGYYEHGLSPWDIAAGALIAREAGCIVRSVEKASDYEGTLMAAAPGIADALLAALIADSST